MVNKILAWLSPASIKGLVAKVVSVIVFVVGIIFLTTTKTKDRMLKESLEQQIKKRDKIKEAVDGAPRDVEEAIDYLKRRK